MIKVISILGGRKTLGLIPRSPLDWVYLLRKGFPAASLTAFSRRTGMADAELAQMLGISVRALASRRSKTVPLSSFESERLLRAAKVIARAEEVFGSVAKGVSWLRAGQLSFGAAPLSLIDTQVGTELVLDSLGRIEHGIFA